MTIITKAIVPARRKGLITRRRLLDILYQGLDFKLTMVCAAAGYGKTSLLVDFAHDADLPVCWLTLDEEDGDATQFLGDVVTSVSRQFTGFGERTLSVLGSGTGAAEAVGALINELVAQVPDFFVLVLDDYHLADTPGVGQVMDRLLRFLPSHVHVILSGRTLPGIDLIRLTAKQEIVALVPQELCFTAGETAALLAANHNLSVQMEDAEALTRRMRGWVTGIILATQRLTRHLMPRLQRTEGTLDVIYSYLAREVLALQSPPVRDFLLQTAVLRWMAAEMCDALLYRSDAAAVLSMLEEHHLFIERVEGEAEVRYRYHPLFREFLLEQLENWGVDRRQALHRRSAELCVQAGDKEEAVRHWLSAGALGEAAPLVDSLARTLFISGRHAMLLDWRQKLGGLAENAPRLELYVAKVLTDTGDHAQALELLERLLADPLSAAVLPEAQVQQGYIWFRQGRVEDAVGKLAPLVQGRLAAGVEAYALRVLGLCFQRQGVPSQARDHLLRALAIYEGLADAFNQSRVLLDLATVLAPLGQTDQILRYQERALEILRGQGNPASLAMALNNSACRHHYVGQFEKAESLYREALVNARQSGLLRVEGFIALGRADLRRDTGQPEDASGLYEQGLRLLEAVGEPWLRDYARIGIARCRRMMGDLTQARACIDMVGATSDACLEAKRQIERGTILAAADDRDGAVAALAAGRDALLAQEAYPQLAAAELRLGEALRQAGDAGAATALERALEASSWYPEGDVRFALEARHCPELLALGERQSINPPALGRLRHLLRELDRSCARFAQGAPEGVSPTLLQVFALGAGRVLLDGKEITTAEWGRISARLLFFFMVDRARVQRSELIRHFWPDAPGHKATSRLQTTLHCARRAVGPDRLRYLPGEAAYRVEVGWYDVDEFEATLARAREAPLGKRRAALLQEAIELYSGPYLSDVDEVWVTERRRTLEMAYLEAVIDLGDCCYAEHDYDQAQAWYRRALGLDNYREDVHRRLILALVQGGRRAEGLRQYDRCARMLRDELGVEPDPVTRTLLEQIKTP